MSLNIEKEKIKMNFNYFIKKVHKEVATALALVKIAMLRAAAMVDMRQEAAAIDMDLHQAMEETAMLLELTTVVTALDQTQIDSDRVRS
jgi:hypothetical protein